MRLSEQLDAAMTRLTRTPGLGHRRDDLITLDVWFYRVHHYLVIYRRTRPLQIVRVVHGAPHRGTAQAR
jgi:plasmid stabilization system protein ParE